MSFNIKRLDLLPVLRMQLVDPSGTAANLTGTSVVFNMSLRDGTSKIARGAVTVVDAATGVVEYAWSGADTSAAGVFTAEFEVMYSGKPLTYPNNDFFKVIVLPDLA